MEIQGTYLFKAPLADVWDALLDPAVLAKALPGGDTLERVGENDYKGAMNVKVGPVQGKFEGKVTLSDVIEHQSYRMKVSGTGTPGFLNGEGLLALSENSEGTLMTYSGDVQVGGRIAAVGQRLIDSTAKSIIRQGLKTLDEQILQVGSELVSIAPSASNDPVFAESRSVTPPSLPQSTIIEPKPAPDIAEMSINIAKDVVQDLASDYVPREKQPQVFAFILGALTMLLFVVLVRLVQRD